MRKFIRQIPLGFDFLVKFSTVLVILDKGKFSIVFSIPTVEKWYKPMENSVDNVENLVFTRRKK